jgi:hypothetical protein
MPALLPSQGLDACFASPMPVLIPSQGLDHNRRDERDGSEEDDLQPENCRVKHRTYTLLRTHKPNKLDNTCKPLVNGEKLHFDKILLIQVLYVSY